MTRREVLQQALSAPLALHLDPCASLRILSEPNCLSQESATAFRSLRLPSNLTVLCGVANIGKTQAIALREQLRRGRSVLWELSPHTTGNQRHALRDIFGIVVGEPFTPSPKHLYIEYDWPHPALTRSFSEMLPLRADATPIASYQGMPIAVKRGGLIVLGSLLGPNIYAEEAQSNQVLSAIFSRITSADTSTTTSTNT
ncbi:MAG: hypothetical protein JO340_13215 [Acidobacteriaceae bacterium]|nr:hypothetical protein [Acidobacteriaceae bacterium]